MRKFFVESSKSTRLFWLLLLLCPFFSYAQSDETSLQKQQGVRLSVITPGLQYFYENRLGNNSTFEISAGVNTNFHFRKADETRVVNGTKTQDKLREFSYLISPNISLGYKYFYDREKRALNNKNLENNSGNYIGSRISNGIEGWRKEFSKVNDGATVSKTNFSKEYRGQLAVFWGMNRSLGKGFMFNFELGPGIEMKGSNKIKFVPHLQTGIIKVF